MDNTSPCSSYDATDLRALCGVSLPWRERRESLPWSQAQPTLPHERPLLPPVPFTPLSFSSSPVPLHFCFPSPKLKLRVTKSALSGVWADPQPKLSFVHYSGKIHFIWQQYYWHSSEVMTGPRRNAEVWERAPLDHA